MATKKKTTTKTKEAEEKALEPKQFQPPAEVDPELLAKMSGQGFEEADRDAYAIPFLRILQTNSPQCNEDEASYIKGAKPGMFFNTVTGKLYGKTIRVVPVHYGRSFIEWLPNRGGFVKDNGPDPRIMEKVVEVDDRNNALLANGNIIQDTRNHFVLIADALDEGPIILTLTSTGLKHSRKWMTLLGSLMIPGKNKQAPMFAGVWEITTILNENDEGKWYQIGDRSSTAISFEEWVNQEQLQAAMAARELIVSGTAKADWESTVDPDSGGSYKEQSQKGDDGNADNDVPF